VVRLTTLRACFWWRQPFTSTAAPAKREEERSEDYARHKRISRHINRVSRWEADRLAGTRISSDCRRSHHAKTCLRWLGRDQPDVAEASEAAARIIKDVTRASDSSAGSLAFRRGLRNVSRWDVNELIKK